MLIMQKLSSGPTPRRRRERAATNPLLLKALTRDLPLSDNERASAVQFMLEGLSEPTDGLWREALGKELEAMPERASGGSTSGSKGTKNKGSSSRGRSPR